MKVAGVTDLGDGEYGVIEALGTGAKNVTSLSPDEMQAIGVAVRAVMQRWSGVAVTADQLRRREIPCFALHRRMFHGVSEMFLRPRETPL